MELLDEGTATEMERSASIFEGGAAPHCARCGGPMLPSAFQHGGGASIPLRCFVREVRNGRYVAECIDLDLGAESDTLDGAIEGLGDAIVGYLMVVLEGVETEQEAPAAILRPAPLSHRLRYHFGYLMYKFARALSREPNRTARFYQAPFGLSASQCHP